MIVWDYRGFYEGGEIGVGYWKMGKSRIDRDGGVCFLGRICVMAEVGKMKGIFWNEVVRFFGR